MECRIAAERRRREDGQNNAKNYEGGRQEGKEGEHQGKYEGKHVRDVTVRVRTGLE